MSNSELLLTIPSVELHTVQNQQDTLLHTDTLNLYLEQSAPSGSTILAQVAGVSWRLQRTVPCLKSEDRTYIFSLPEQAGVFYCVILAPDTPKFVVESFEGVLRSSSDFSALEQPSLPGQGPAPKGPGHATTPHHAPPPPGATPNGAPSGSIVSRNVSSGLVAGSGVAAQGLVGLATLTAAGIQKVTQSLVKNTTPSPTGTMAPETRSKLDKATTVINQASTVIKQLANHAGKAADTASRSVTTSLGTNASVQKLNSNPDVQVLTSASKAAGAQLLVGLKEAAKIIALSTTAAVQQYKAHKYPAESPHGNTAVGVPVGAPPAGYAPPQYIPPPSGHPAPHNPAFAPPQYGPPHTDQYAPPQDASHSSSAPPPMHHHAGPAPAGYPAVPNPPPAYGYAPDPEQGVPAAQQTSQSGLYPPVSQPNLYPSEVAPPHAQQPGVAQPN